MRGLNTHPGNQVLSGPGDPTTQRMETGDEAFELRLLTEPLRYNRDFTTGLESHEPCLYTTPQG